MEHYTVYTDPVMLLFALRYSLSRDTYALQITARNIKSNIELLDEGMIRTMIEDMEDSHNYYGKDEESSELYKFLCEAHGKIHEVE